MAQDTNHATHGVDVEPSDTARNLKLEASLVLEAGAEGTIEVPPKTYRITNKGDTPIYIGNIVEE